MQENFFRPLGSTTALDQPAVNAGFVYYINDINNITPDVAGLINLSTLVVRVLRVVRVFRVHQSTSESSESSDPHVLRFSDFQILRSEFLQIIRFSGPHDAQCASIRT